MKVLFLNPCLRPEAPHRYLPVGLGYVITVAAQKGIDFDLLDMDINVLSDQAVESHLRKHRYDVIAIGAIVTHYKWIRRFLHKAREIQPDCQLIVGNSVGSSISEVLFQHTPVDVVILGEADLTFVDVVKTLEAGKPLGTLVEPLEKVSHTNGDLPSSWRGEGIKGIVFRDQQGRIIHNGLRPGIKNIDDLPFPDWDLFDVEQYFKVQKGMAHDTTFYPADQARVMPVNTARGCVFKCTFCHHVFWHDPYRHRSPESVVAEIKRNKNKYGANYIDFWDELSFYKMKPAERFVDVLLEADLGVHWTAAVRADLFGKKEVPYADRRRVVEKFIKAGAIALGYSLESGSDEILNDMNKHMKAEHFAEQARLFSDVGLINNTSLVLGYPRETKQTIAETMQMCEQAGVYPSVGFLLPLPETGMWQHAIENGHIDDVEQFLANMTERQDIVLNMTKMSNETLMAEVKHWLNRLNRSFGNHLDEERLIKTQGYAEHNRHQDEHQHEDVQLPPMNMA
ncbi:MAG: radical SAM protein, partial [Magnetococcales bacterium]|nr:radical SAM protein [Magnetococcales bacterium]